MSRQATITRPRFELRAHNAVSDHRRQGGDLAGGAVRVELQSDPQGRVDGWAIRTSRNVGDRTFLTRPSNSSEPHYIRVPQARQSRPASHYPRAPDPPLAPYAAALLGSCDGAGPADC